MSEDVNRPSADSELQLIKRKLLTLSKDPNVKQRGKGKEPLCWFDVEELIWRIPNGFKSKNMEASLFLFALHTGSRAMTCDGVWWCDIQGYEYDES